MAAGAPGSPVFDFVSTDFESVQDDLISFAESVFPNELWTDFNSSNFGTYLLQLMAYASDLLSYNANSEALETVVTTLVKTQNFINIAKSLDYTLSSASPSSGTETLTLDPLGTYPFTISSHLQFSTASGIIFQPIADTSVASYPGGGTVTVDIIQGKESFEENVGQTNGTPGQAFTLANSPLIDGTLQISVGADSYSLVENAIEAASTDKTYTITVDENGITTVTLGDGINGIIPPTNQSILATYKTGGGLDTNVTQETINQVSGTSDGSLIPSQILSVTNNTVTDGGGPAQSLESGQQNLPLSLKANERGVTSQDYATLAVKHVPGVFKANAVAGKFYGGSAPILLFVVPQGGGNPSDVLKNQIQIALKNLKLAGKRIRVLNPIYVNLAIELDLFVLKNSPAAVVSNRVRSVLDSKYSLTSVDFGQTFSLQDAYDSISPTAVVGVSRAFFKQFTILPYFAAHINSPTLGNGEVEGITIDTDTVERREWLIHVIPAQFPITVSQFVVVQRMLGTVTSVTDNLITDESANYTPNALLTTPNGWYLHPNPETNPISVPLGGTGMFTITGNTSQTISVPGGLLVNVEPDDPYVVEKQEPTLGKILRTSLTSAAASNVLAVGSSANFQAGDTIRIWSSSQSDITTVISTPTGTSIHTADSIVAPSGAIVDYMWVSQDGSVKFSLVNATQMVTPPTSPANFITGDELYVDTYPQTGDLNIRSENFPRISDSNFLINTIGGVK